MVHIKKNLKKKKNGVWVWAGVCTRACACVPVGTHIGWGDQTVQRKEKSQMGRAQTAAPRHLDAPPLETNIKAAWLH